MQWREFQKLQEMTQIGERFISYVEAGDGEPVVLIHGIPTWGYLWHSTIDALKDDFRVLAPDLIGFGYSDKGDNFDRSIAAQAEALDLWLETLDIPSAHIVGQDIGGGVALRMATLFPDRVRSLCVMNTVCYDSWPIELMLQFGHPEMYRKVSASKAMKLLKQALKMGFETSPDDEFLDALLEPYSTETGKLSLIRNASALNTNLTAEITHLLPKIDVPGRILWGENDKFQLVKYGEWLARDIPGAELVRIPNARHFLMIDKPAEVNGALKNFLVEASAQMQRLET
ncbi:MAG: alpha/beta hydrolase [Verrucomicrobia bacterium]|nr:alpha/beta hydrolase [Verrucomicrobiota bacterium]